MYVIPLSFDKNETRQIKTVKKRYKNGETMVNLFFDEEDVKTSPLTSFESKSHHDLKKKKKKKRKKRSIVLPIKQCKMWITSKYPKKILIYKTVKCVKHSKERIKQYIVENKVQQLRESEIEAHELWFDVAIQHGRTTCLGILLEKYLRKIDPALNKVYEKQVKNFVSHARYLPLRDSRFVALIRLYLSEATNVSDFEKKQIRDKIGFYFFLHQYLYRGRLISSLKKVERDQIFEEFWERNREKLVRLIKKKRKSFVTLEKRVSTIKQKRIERGEFETWSETLKRVFWETHIGPLLIVIAFLTKNDPLKKSLKYTGITTTVDRAIATFIAQLDLSEKQINALFLDEKTVPESIVEKINFYQKKKDNTYLKCMSFVYSVAHEYGISLKSLVENYNVPILSDDGWVVSMLRLKTSGLHGERLFKIEKTVLGLFNLQDLVKMDQNIKNFYMVLSIINDRTDLIHLLVNERVVSKRYALERFITYEKTALFEWLLEETTDEFLIKELIKLSRFKKNTKIWSAFLGRIKYVPDVPKHILNLLVKHTNDQTFFLFKLLKHYILGKNRYKKTVEKAIKEVIEWDLDEYMAVFYDVFKEPFEKYAIFAYEKNAIKTLQFFMYPDFYIKDKLRLYENNKQMKKIFKDLDLQKIKGFKYDHEKLFNYVIKHFTGKQLRQLAIRDPWFLIKLYKERGVGDLMYYSLIKKHKTDFIYFLYHMGIDFNQEINIPGEFESNKKDHPILKMVTLGPVNMLAIFFRPPNFSLSRQYARLLKKHFPNDKKIQRLEREGPIKVDMKPLKREWVNRDPTESMTVFLLDQHFLPDQNILNRSIIWNWMTIVERLSFILTEYFEENVKKNIELAMFHEHFDIMDFFIQDAIKKKRRGDIGDILFDLWIEQLDEMEYHPFRPKDLIRHFLKYNINIDSFQLFDDYIFSRGYIIGDEEFVQFLFKNAQIQRAFDERLLGQDEYDDVLMRGLYFTALKNNNNWTLFQKILNHEHFQFVEPESADPFFVYEEDEDTEEEIHFKRVLKGLTHPDIKYKYQEKIIKHPSFEFVWKWKDGYFVKKVIEQDNITFLTKTLFPKWNKEKQLDVLIQRAVHYEQEEDEGEKVAMYKEVIILLIKKIKWGYSRHQFKPVFYIIEEQEFELYRDFYQKHRKGLGNKQQTVFFVHAVLNASLKIVEFIKKVGTLNKEYLLSKMNDMFQQILESRISYDMKKWFPILKRFFELLPTSTLVRFPHNVVIQYHEIIPHFVDIYIELKHKQAVGYFLKKEYFNVRGKTVNKEYETGMTQRMLKTAALHGSTEIFKAIYYNKRKKIEANDQVLLNASNGNHMDIIKILWDDKNVDFTVQDNVLLKNAIINKNIGLVRLLLKRDEILESIQKEYQWIGLAFHSQEITQLLVDHNTAINIESIKEELQFEGKLNTAKWVIRRTNFKMDIYNFKYVLKVLRDETVFTGEE